MLVPIDEYMIYVRTYVGGVRNVSGQRLRRARSLPGHPQCRLIGHSPHSRLYTTPLERMLLSYAIIILTTISMHASIMVFLYGDFYYLKSVKVFVVAIWYAIDIHEPGVAIMCL